MSIERFFEAATGSLLVFALFVFGVFIAYLHRHVSDAWRVGQFQGVKGLFQYMTIEMQGAVALATFFLGLIVTFFVLWGWVYLRNDGIKIEGITKDYFTLSLIAGTGLCCVGCFCLLRVFPAASKRVAIQLIAASGVAAVIGLAFLH